MWKIVDDELKSSFMTHPAVAAELHSIMARVQSGETLANVAAEHLLSLYRSPSLPSV